MNKQDKNKVEANVKADIVLKARHIFDDFKDFTDGVRCLFLIHRNKEGGDTNNTKVRKVITKNSQEFYVELLKLVDEKERNLTIPYRIYSSVNARDVEKAIRQFKLEQLEADYYDTESRHSFYYDSKNRFIGALMTPSSRVKANCLFIIDVDNKETINDTMGDALTECGKNNVEIVTQYRTKNGWHIVCKPFNPANFDQTKGEIKKDGLLLLAY